MCWSMSKPDDSNLEVYYAVVFFFVFLKISYNKKKVLIFLMVRPDYIKWKIINVVKYLGTSKM